MSDDPFAGAFVIDQQLSDPDSIAGNTYTPSSNTIRWQNPPPVAVEDEYEITVFDAAGTEYTLVAIGTTTGYQTDIVGLAFEGPAPPPGTTVYFDYNNSTVTDGTSMVPCFASDTLIDTIDGPMKVQDIQKGTLVKTIDKGFQPVVWIASSEVNLTAGKEHLRPIKLKKDCLGSNIPSQDVKVSPAHRILIDGPEAELMFGEAEVLASAKHLLNDHSIVRDHSVTKVTYWHLMFAQHEVIVTSNLRSESFNPGQVALNGLEEDARAELFELFPELQEPKPSAYVSTARLVLKQHEAQLVLQ